MAQAPNPRRHARTKARAAAKTNDGMAVVVNGERYPLRLDALSPDEVRECRRVTGMSPQGIVRALQSDPDIDLVANLMWLSLRQRGERVTLAEVQDGVDYSADLDFDSKLADGDEDPESPEA